MQNSKSFTLIELLVVISIIALFSAFGIARISDFGQQKNLEKESQKIVEALTLAKNKTVTGDASLCSVSPPTLPSVDYLFIRYTNATSYQLLPSCLVGTAISQTYTVLSGVTITSPFADIRFSRLSGTVTPVCFEVMKGSACRFIQVTAQGVINEGSTTCGGTCP